MLLGLLQFIDVVLSLIIFIMIAQVIVSWLLAFNILNMSNQFVAMVANALYRSPNRSCARSGDSCPISAGSTSPPSSCFW